MPEFSSDLRYALRTLRGSPTFTVTALLTLALGTAAATTIYSVVATILLRPLPYRDSDRLVRVIENAPHPIAGRPPLQRGLPLNELRDWQQRTRAFQTSTAVAPMAQRAVRTARGWAGLWGLAVADDTFSVLGVQPALGRAIDSSDRRDTEVVMLSHGTWRRHFNANPAIVGTIVEFRTGALLSPIPPRFLRVIGVLPASFEFPTGMFDFYSPLTIDGQNAPRVTMIARLPRDVSLAAAIQEANTLGGSMRPAWPATALPLSRPRLEVEQLKALVTEPVEPALRVLLAAVGLVVVIVCANVANLLLTRGTGRQREMAVRAAVGATRGRLIRLVIMECAVLALAAAGVGAALAAGGVVLVQRLSATDAPGIFRLMFGTTVLPRTQELAVDARVFGIALGIAALACAVFSVLPALRSSRASHLHVLAARGSDTSRGVSRLRDALAVAQLALATVLLIGSGLLAFSFVRLSTFDKGYDASRVLALNLLFPDTYSIARKAATIESLLTRFRETAGVQAAGFARHGLLIGEELYIGTFVPPGRTREEMSTERIRVRAVSDGFLTAMGVPVVAGRELQPEDSPTAPLVIVLNRSAASRYFPGGAVGRSVDWYVGRNQTQAEIVGVVEDVRQRSAADVLVPEAFVEYRQFLRLQHIWQEGAPRQNEATIGFLSFAVRTAGAPAATAPGIARVVEAIDPNIGIDTMVPLEELEAGSVARERFYAIALGIFAAVAAVLAVIGIYGVLAYAVAQRTQEIGIRVALGARPDQVRRLVVTHGAKVTALGLTIGLAAAAGVVRSLEGLLFGIQPLDPSMFGVVAALFSCVSLAAAWIPARRATHVDPLIALRHE